ncbi:hypothetical protein [Prosthecobacter dejongeii]|uniref:Uncharacterized protein n=1 Tax=Prosthecobacter dejongeii TaxID=48465 RepID=A0A7W7YL32_9BACT|nr:hypothetical protein [Prosthecobacter dejongeii]MBB5038054.1 hypothetical protein [Prosthecobacter dejongeii]
MNTGLAMLAGMARIPKLLDSHPDRHGFCPNLSSVNLALLSGFCLWLGGLALLAVPTTMPGAEPDPKRTLDLARLSFQRNLLEVSLAPLKKHLSELILLEKSRAETRDYTGAIEARDLRKRLETELERLDKELLLLQTREQSIKASLLPDRIRLPIEAAKLSGVRRDGGALTGWAKPGATAEWKLGNLPPGGYEVVLRYRCTPLEGGALAVQEARFSLMADVETTLKGPQEKNLGTLKITDGTGPLKIRARTVLKDNLMQLLAVELVPASK